MTDPGETILNRLLSSKAKGELLMLFHRNPGLVDNIDGIAMRMGRRSGSIRHDLEDLVDMGVLRTIQVGSSRVICLDRKKDKEMLLSVTDHLRKLER
jgi:predicted transcriptional regulator